MSTPTTWWIPVRPEGTGYRGDARNYFAARGTTVRTLSQSFRFGPEFFRPEARRRGGGNGPPVG